MYNNITGLGQRFKLNFLRDSWNQRIYRSKVKNNYQLEEYQLLIEFLKLTIENILDLYPQSDWNKFELDLIKDESRLDLFLNRLILRIDKHYYPFYSLRGEDSDQNIIDWFNSYITDYFEKLKISSKILLHRDSSLVEFLIEFENYLVENVSFLVQSNHTRDNTWKRRLSQASRY